MSWAAQHSMSWSVRGGAATGVQIRRSKRRTPRTDIERWRSIFHAVFIPHRE